MRCANCKYWFGCLVSIAILTCMGQLFAAAVELLLRVSFLLHIYAARPIHRCSPFSFSFSFQWEGPHLTFNSRPANSSSSIFSPPAAITNAVFIHSIDSLSKLWIPTHINTSLSLSLSRSVCLSPSFFSPFSVLLIWLPIAFMRGGWRTRIFFSKRGSISVFPFFG